MMRRVVLAVCVVMGAMTLGSSRPVESYCYLSFPDVCCHPTPSGRCMDGGKWCSCEQFGGPGALFCDAQDDQCYMIV